MTTKPRIPAVEGWFTTGDEPSLLGLKCPACETYVFPPRAIGCPNPGCHETDLETVPLSRSGTVWSFAVNHYAPPEPYMAPDPFVPYAVAAVELSEERMVVLGQVSGDHGSLAIGARVELVIETLFDDHEGDHVVWKWRVQA